MWAFARRVGFSGSHFAVFAAEGSGTKISNPIFRLTSVSVHFASEPFAHESGKLKSLLRPAESHLLGILTNSSGMAKSTEKDFVEDLDSHIVWVDLEMSGLDPEVHKIVEMAVIITDSELNVVAESPEIVIHHDQDVIENMSDWCKDTFAKSGLTEEIRSSEISMDSTKKTMMTFLRQHIPYKKCILAGNSVYMDRLFLKKQMPEFDDYLHYRILDVSTLKELSRRWYPSTHYKQPKKKCAHRALADIRESIEELKWYRSNILRPK